MSRNLSHALWVCPPCWNTVSLHSTIVDHCTISYGTGRVVGTVSYTRTSTVGICFMCLNQFPVFLMEPRLRGGIL